MIAPADTPLDAHAPDAREPARPARSVSLDRARGWLLPLLVLGVWELLSRAGVLPPHWFPAPTRLAQTIVELGARGELVRHVGATLLRIALGFSSGVALGTTLGVATGRSPRLRAWLDPSLQALRSIPSLAWVPLFLLWLGIGETSKIALIALGVFFPVYLNLTAGLDAIDRHLLQVAELYSYRRVRLARHVLLPAALPAYITGLRSGLGLGWMFVVAAELMGASRGLGYLLVDGQTTSRPELVMAAIACFALLGKLTDIPLAAWSRSRQQRS
ncbi:MAG TPA: ABC transporter permease [Polyangiaceae bacterium]|nr:ABC transporter permease [Polyangiaceae bacterium]